MNNKDILKQVTVRTTWVSFIPEEWKQREAEGRCPVCGAHKGAFEPGMKKFCSEKCKQEYSSKLVYWESLRQEVLKRDNYTCQECGINQQKLEEDWNRKKEFYKDQNIKFIQENARDLIERTKEKINQDIQDKLESIYKDLELLADERLLIEKELLRYSFALEQSKIKLPYPESTGSPPKLVLEVDHKVAVANGGDMWDLNNLQTLCHSCHVKKTRRDMIEHRRRKKGLKSLEEVIIQ